MNCPRITIGCGATANGTWPLTLSRQVAFTMDRYYGSPFSLMTGERVLAEYFDGRMIVRSGYASDGYSPVIAAPWKSFDDPWWRLTPTPACGFAPAVLHDITRQFLNVPGCPWGRQQTDDWFFDCMIAGGTTRRRAGVYHHAVAGIVGDIYIRATRAVDPNLGIVFL